MKLLVTGGAGCLGSSISAKFLGKAESVVVLDNFSTGSRAWLPTDSRLEVVEGDVRNASFVKRVFQEHRPTHVVHAAGSYADPDDWVGDLETNTLGTLNVARAAEELEVSHLIYLQTALAYGSPQQSPIPTSHSIRPEGSYAVSKVAGELYVLGSSVPVALSLRIANTCAPHLSIGPLPVFYQKILAGDVCKVSPAERDFLDVDDFLDLLDLIFGALMPERSAYNVSTGHGRSIEELFRLLAAQLGKPQAAFETVPLQYGDIASVVLDSSLTQKQFSWVPKKTFEETLARQVRWFENFGIQEVRSHLKSIPYDKES